MKTPSSNITVGRVSIGYFDALGGWYSKSLGLTRNPLTAQRWAEEMAAGMPESAPEEIKQKKGTTPPENKKNRQRPVWEAYEVCYLIDVLGEKSVKSIAIKLSRSPSDVLAVINALNLNRQNDER